MKTKNFFKRIRSAHMLIIAGVIILAGSSVVAQMSLQNSSALTASVVNIPFPVKNYSDISRIADQWGFTVTSTTGGEHNTGSAHYQGRAIDVSVKKKSEQQITDFMNALRKAGIKVLDERVRPNSQAVWGGAHLHIQIGMRDCKDLSGYVETNKFSLTTSAPCEGQSVLVSTNGKTTKEIRQFITDARRWGMKVTDKSKKPKNKNEAWSGPYLRLQISKPKQIMSPPPPENVIETKISNPTTTPIETPTLIPATILAPKKYTVAITFNGTDTFNWENDVRIATFATTISFDKIMSQGARSTIDNVPFNYTCSAQGKSGSLNDTLANYQLSLSTDDGGHGLQLHYNYGPDYKYFGDNTCGGLTIDPHGLADEVLNDLFGSTRAATQEPGLLYKRLYDTNGETVPFSGDIVKVSGKDHYIYAGTITITPLP